MGKQAKKLINMLWKVKGACLFHKPVDPFELGISDYFQIIKNPMDLQRLKKNYQIIYIQILNNLLKILNLFLIIAIYIMAQIVLLD